MGGTSEIIESGQLCQDNVSGFRVMVHLNENHAIPLQRTTALMEDFFGLPVSQATVVEAALRGAEILQPTVDAIGKAA